MKRKAKMTGEEIHLSRILARARKEHAEFKHHRIPKLRWSRRVYRKYFLARSFDQKLFYALLYSSTEFIATVTRMQRAIREWGKTFNAKMIETSASLKAINEKYFIIQ